MLRANKSKKILSYSCPVCSKRRFCPWPWTCCGADRSWKHRCIEDGKINCLGESFEMEKNLQMLFQWRLWKISQILDALIFCELSHGVHNRQGRGQTNKQSRCVFSIPTFFSQEYQDPQHEVAAPALGSPPLFGHLRGDDSDNCLSASAAESKRQDALRFHAHAKASRTWKLQNP